MKKLLFFALFIAAAFGMKAQNVDNKWGLDIQLGKTEYYGDLENQYFFKGDPHLFGGIALNRYMSKSFDLGLTTTYGVWAGALNGKNYDVKFSGKLFDASMLLKFKLNNGSILRENAKLAPYITAGIGYGYFGSFEAPSSIVANQTNPYKGGNIIIPVGFGIKYNISQKVALQYQLLLNFSQSDKHDNTTYKSNGKLLVDGKNDNFLKHSLSLVISFGKPKDTDNDGVIDRLDLCPNTPANVAVTATGCPVDSDSDGVPDYLDKCPDTPANVAVTASGCPVDSDGDGVPDYLDKCPNTPAKVKVDKKGCPVDTDGDGVADYLDKCPNTPANTKVDSKGCAIDIDSDKDGVNDNLDKCPNTPANVKVDASGCPLDADADGIPDYLDRCPEVKGTKANNGCPEIKKEEKDVFKNALQGIQFETGKDVIKKTSNTILNNIADIMKANPAYKLNIIGHTDNVGMPESNLKLSQKRAEAVKKYLAKQGVDVTRIKAIGRGDTVPVADNKTPEGRTQNRRVEFAVEF